MRMEENKAPLKCYNWTPAGKGPTERPRKRWRDRICEAVAARGETIENVEEMQLFADGAEWNHD